MVQNHVIGRIETVQNQTNFKIDVNQEGNDPISLVAKENLGKLETAWNALLALVGIRKWVKIETKDDNQQTKQIYLSVDSIVKEFKIDFRGKKDIVDTLNSKIQETKLQNTIISKMKKEKDINDAKKKLKIEKDEEFINLILKIRQDSKIKPGIREFFDEIQVINIDKTLYIVLEDGGQYGECLNLNTFKIDYESFYN
ncbi:MAG: hypothetical protein Tsb0021_14480 [Chlamydiales bacterium]